MTYHLLTNVRLLDSSAGDLLMEIRVNLFYG